MNFNQSKKGKVVEAPKAQSYFHCSYKLLPDDKESVKADVVTFGVAAKLYTEHDSRVLRPWIDGQKTWVAWTNTYVSACYGIEKACACKPIPSSGFLIAMINSLS